MNGLQRLRDAGQSIWYDNIRRGLLRSGELARYLVDYLVTGVTSNPTIFERAIASTADYDEAIHAAIAAGSDEDPEALFFDLAIDDVTAVADLLRPVHDATSGVDGYVSLEVSPTLAHDAAGTVTAARDLFARAGRPNVMIKVPGTPEGLEAVEELVAAGVNVNVTLLFSTEQYQAAARAYVRGLEWRARSKAGLGVASVASVFVSRWDSAADPELPDHLKGRLGLASAGLTCAAYRRLLGDERWLALAAAGARPQRVLWASTGTKDPHLPDTYYATALAAPDTVDTMPEATLLAVADHGDAVHVMSADGTEAAEVLAAVAEAGVDVERLADELQAAGVKAFAGSFERLLANLESKAAALRADVAASARPAPVSAAEAGEEGLGALAPAVEAAVADLGARHAVRRAYERDHTLWQDDPTEVADRLGWLFSPAQMEHQVGELERFTEECVADGLTHAVLMGMGGSSLFPEVMERTFGAAPGHLDVRVLDTTAPSAVARLAATLPLDHTLFVAASKSGGTLETRSHLEHFWSLVGRGRQFAAITDPGTGLGELAHARGFRRVFENRPDIGGRYSALSFFGLVPAALLGVELAELLHRAGHMAAATAPCVPAEANPAVRLGALMGAGARAGRDKLTILLADEIAGFGLWLEQLIAESTGKRGTGIVPVVGEPLGEPSVYGDDRVFVAIGPDVGAGAAAGAGDLDALAAAGHPTARLPTTDACDIGAEVFRWELATCLAGAVLGINPFDQPNVAEAKAATDHVLAAGLPVVAVEPLAPLLAQVRPHDYLAIQAYVDPEDAVVGRIEEARVRLRDHFGVATTVGIGPRYLHSTGQLHKGGPPTGVFVQVVADPGDDLPIPGRPFGFATLLHAQAAGDLHTLRAHGLRAARVTVDELTGWGT